MPNSNYSPAAWRRLGDLLRAERNGRPRAQIAAETNISHGSIENYESGRVYRQPPDKLWRLARYYGWTPDSLRGVLEGGLPTYLPGGREAAAVTPVPPPPPHEGIEDWLRDLVRSQSDLSVGEKNRKLRNFDDLLRAGRPDPAPPARHSLT